MTTKRFPHKVREGSTNRHSTSSERRAQVPDFEEFEHAIKDVQDRKQISYAVKMQNNVRAVYRPRKTRPSLYHNFEAMLSLSVHA